MSPRVNRFWRRIYTHHLPLAMGTIACVVVLYITRSYPDWISRLSFATAYPAVILLMATLCVGPFNVLRRRRNPVSSDLRRDIGIWAGVVGVLHAVVGQCVHLRGRPWLYYIYERSQGHLFPLRHDQFGFANYTGLLAALFLIALFATSNDLSLRTLGTPGWKRLQRWNYLCFGLAAIHTVLYQATEARRDGFVVVSSISILLTIAIQLLGFARRRTT